MNSADILARLKENEAASRARRCACSPVPADTALKTFCTKSTRQPNSALGRTTFLGARLFRLSRQAMRAPELADGLYIRPFLETAKNARRQTVRP
jgi:hypothetical protein